MNNFLFSRLHFYLCRIFLKWFGIVLFGVMCIVSLFEAIELFRKSMSHLDVGLPLIAEIILLKLPTHFHVLLPFMVLATTMITFIRLNHSSELVIMRTAGISIWQMVSGVCLTVLGIGVFYLCVINPIQSILTSRLYFLEDRIFNAQHHNLILNESGLWLREVDDKASRIYHIKTFNLQQHYFKNLSIFEYDNDKNTVSRRYDVGEAILQESKWYLHHVSLYENGKQNEYEELSLSTSYSQEKIQESNAAPETLSFWQIPSFIQLLDKSGLSSLQYRLHFQNHMAKILLMMAMVLIATGFCLKPARFGKTSVLMTLGLSFGFFFYFMNDIIYALGLGQRIPIFLSVWAPSFLGLLIGGVILIRIEEESK